MNTDLNLTNNCKIYTLFSGSSGNCTYIKSKHASILIDAGKSARAICCALLQVGSDISKIDGIFITHEHADHISALGTLMKKYRIPVHAVYGCSNAIINRVDNSDCVYEHDAKYSVKVGDLTVSSFRTSHDCACGVGYKIETDDGHTYGVATDTGIVTNAMGQALTGCEACVIECNHDIGMLENGPYPQSLKERIHSRFGHLSNDVCAKFVRYLYENGTRNFILAHLSKENNTPLIALETVKRAVPFDDAHIKVAKPDEPVRLI